MGDARDPTGKIEPSPPTRDRPHLRGAGAQGGVTGAPDPAGATSVQTASGASMAASPSPSTDGAAGRGSVSPDVAGTAKESAGKATEYAKAKTRSFAEEQKAAAAGQIGGVADALRKSAQQLQQDEQSAVAGYVDRAAEGLDGFARSLRDQDMRALMTQAEGLARRQPGLFVGGAVLGGFLLARFLKSSGERGEFVGDRAESAYGTRDRYSTAGVGPSAPQRREI